MRRFDLQTKIIDSKSLSAFKCIVIIYTMLWSKYEYNGFLPSYSIFVNLIEFYENWIYLDWYFPILRLPVNIHNF